MDNQSVRVVRLHEIGGPEVLKIDNVPLPNPEKNEVRLRVQAIGLNRAEVMFRSGHYLTRPIFPSKIGYEASGIVDAVGPGGDQSLVGKKFSTVPCFDLGKYGVYGEVAIVPTYALAAYPNKLSPEQATSIWMQYLTAYGALIHYGHLTKGDYIIITAASSSVGIAAIEIARAEGAISIAVTRTAKKKAQLQKLGADHVIVTDEEDLVARVKEITNDHGARIIFDPIGGKGLENLAAACARGGMIFEYGVLSTEPTPFPLSAALGKGLIIRGYTLFEVTSAPELRAQAEKYVYERLENGTFNPLIARTFKFDEIVAAHRFMESNEQVGKIVVSVP